MRTKPYARPVNGAGLTWVRSGAPDAAGAVTEPHVVGAPWLEDSVDELGETEVPVTPATPRAGSAAQGPAKQQGSAPQGRSRPPSLPPRTPRYTPSLPPSIVTRRLHAPDLDSQPFPIRASVGAMPSLEPGRSTSTAQAPPPSSPIQLDRARLVSLDGLRPMAGDSLPPLDDYGEEDALVAAAAAHAPAEEEDLSTGLFESMEWEGADGTAASRSRDLMDPPSEDQHTSKAFERPPSLSVVRSVADSIENEFHGMRAVPLDREPRPAATDVVDWPPPMVRPTLDYPPDWSPDDVGDTRIVLDPVRAPRSRGMIFLLDAAAWLLGFTAMFLTGLVTTGSAALVLFAISI